MITAPNDERVLLLAPTGRDAQLLHEILDRGGIVSESCSGLEELSGKLTEGAGAVLLAEEALDPSGMERLTLALQHQPPWSDLPVVVSTHAGETTEARVRTLERLSPGGNVIMVERPVRVLTLLATLDVTLRARRRQYQMRDLLEQQVRQTEELRTERVLRERFVAVLAHDLRGPLQAAKLQANRLMTHPESLDQRRDLAVRIDRNIDRADKMIRDLLDVSRIQAGQQLPLRLEECDLLAIASDVAEELNTLHPERVVVRAKQPVRGIWSADELRRAIWNLASNAIKYGSPEHPVSLSISTSAGSVTLAVHNRGKPLSQQETVEIFQPFTRSFTAETTTSKGWGLGLTLVRGCAEAHGGRVRVESSAEAGTTFSIELPRDARPFQKYPVNSPS
jgi:signal transduction histidine kinase